MPPRNGDVKAQQAEQQHRCDPLQQPRPGAGALSSNYLHVDPPKFMEVSGGLEGRSLWPFSLPAG